MSPPQMLHAATAVTMPAKPIPHGTEQEPMLLEKEKTLRMRTGVAERDSSFCKLAETEER